MNQLSENSRVQVRFLLGPAGTGKTFRCLEEIRAELKCDPAGPPLLFLAPKQATFQIERQLLSDSGLPGYTRLQILSFDRLAEFVMESLGHPAVTGLSEEGRVMVLRSLLAQKEGELGLFRSSARLPGFAQQLSALLREVQQQGLSADRLIDAAGDRRIAGTLRDKLHDVALILRAYRQWLNANHLVDAEQALDSAAEALTDSGSGHKKFQGGPGGIQLWLDGFAEMTPQELRLLSAFVPWCERATLAFCLENEPSAESGSWLSLWSVVAQTFRSCLAELEAALPKGAISIEVLSRHPVRGRFAGSEVLAHVEAHWSRPEPLRARRDAEALTPAVGEGNVDLLAAREKPLRVVRCATPEAEAVFAAREILHFVRDDGGRFRDCAVLLRTLDGYHDTLRRVFTRYEIPFFLDRRELITHHPLAELTRFALRLAAFGWRQEDWFGALKTGLVHQDEAAIDQLENEALARGWEGAAWTKPLVARDGTAHRLEPLRRRVTPPFERLSHAVAGSTTGLQLGATLRRFWEDLEVEAILQRWAEAARTIAPTLPAVHETVPTQMEDWLENIERAFPRESLPVAEWLPILEAGLAGLSVGVIPPALDQVLVGTIDRSRNPDLRLALVLGMNETVFPAPPPHAPILTEAERSLLTDVLARKKQSLGISTRQRIAHERYFGYIACTRSRERLVLTCSSASARGVALNPSPFLLQLDKLVPGVFPPKAEEQEHFSVPDWREAEHASEVAAPLINESHPELAPLATIDSLAGAVARARAFKSSSLLAPLPPEIVAGLYPPPFTTSVSALEDFAACPFKFFLRSGLRLKEREEFEVDHRQKGILQHEVLSEFHVRATAQGKQWRDWKPPEAAELVREIGREKLKQFENGLFDADDARRFTGAVLLETLARLVSTLVAWMTHYRFNPRAVELSFGMGEAALPGWRLALEDGRELVLCGRIDRIDVCERGEGEALGVVMDYKSSGKKVDATKLHHGLELQLLSYLGFLQQLPATGQLPKLEPAGVFYIGLRGQARLAKTRAETFEEPERTLRTAFRHEGRFNEAWLSSFDAGPCGEQFSAHLTTRLNPAVFKQLMADVEAHLKRFGAEILDGKMSIAPYRRNQRDTACLHCEFHGICRFDPWVEPYRALQPPPRKTAFGKRRAA